MYKLSTCLLTAICLLYPMQSIPAAAYLQWDNLTPAGDEDLLQDPLLMLRTADRGTLPASALPTAWQRIAQCDFFNEREIAAAIPFAGELAATQPCAHSGTLEAFSLADHFDHSRPVFLLSSAAQWDAVHWQISTTADFASVSSTLDVIEPFTSSIHLSTMAETFLNSGHTYFFRAQGIAPPSQSAWSYPLAFTVAKPAAPQRVHIRHTPDSAPQLCWEGPIDDDTRYLVFGSNSIDFVPAVYTPYQIDALHNGKITAASPADNFLGETGQTTWPIDGRCAYYRVLAKAHGQLSIPSPLVFNYATKTHAQRDVLHANGKSLKSADMTAWRTPFPAPYSWMQAHTPDGCSKYVRNARVSQDVWEQLNSYFLPENHPAKPFLDKVFSKNQLLASRAHFKKAGFDLLTSNQKNLVVAKHAKLKGYLIKAFLDAEPNTEWEWWKKRIDGALAIQQSIANHGYQAMLKVPKKWIYPLPPRDDIAGPQKQFVLIVEDMQLQKKKEIRKSYYYKVTRPLLNALFVIITENLLIDSIFADNIPFCQDGRIAFVDTEHYNDTTQPVRLWMIARYLSPEMHAYWDQVLIHNRPL